MHVTNLRKLHIFSSLETHFFYLLTAMISFMAPKRPYASFMLGQDLFISEAHGSKVLKKQVMKT